MENRTLVYAKNINNIGSGIIDVSKNPPEIYCYCTPMIAEEILNALTLLTKTKHNE